MKSSLKGQRISNTRSAHRLPAPVHKLNSHGSCSGGLFHRKLGTMPMQQCNLSDVQLLSKHQELNSHQDHICLHLIAVDHRRLHHAVTRC